MEYEKMLAHLDELVKKIMDGKAKESEMEIKLVIEGTDYIVPLNADTYTALATMIEEEIKHETQLDSPNN